MSAAVEAQHSPVKLLSLADLDADDDAPWPVDGLVAPEGVTMIYGPAAGDAALALARSLAFRKAWRGRETRRAAAPALLTWRKKRDTCAALTGARDVMLAPDTALDRPADIQACMKNAAVARGGIVVVDQPEVRNFLDLRKLALAWADAAETTGIPVVFCCPASVIDSTTAGIVRASLWCGAIHVPGRGKASCTWVAGERDAPDDYFIFADGTGDPIPDSAIADGTRARCEKQARASLKWIADAAERKFLSIADMENAPPPGWLIDGVVPETGLTFVYGSPKTGKSFLGLSMTLHVAAGRPWFGRSVLAGPVIYMAGEGSGGMGPRIAAARAEHGIPADVPFKVMPRAVKLSDPRAVLAFIRDAADECGMPVLIVIDTLARATAGTDENAVQDMSAAIERADDIKRAFGCAVMVMHHSGKDTTRGMRGSSSLEGAADCVMQVTRPSKEERDKGEADVMTLANPVMKDGPEFANLFFDVVKVPGGRDGSIVLRERADAPPKAPRLTPAQKAAEENVLALFERAGAACVLLADAVQACAGDIRVTRADKPNNQRTNAKAAIAEAAARGGRFFLAGERLTLTVPE